MNVLKSSLRVLWILLKILAISVFIVGTLVLILYNIHQKVVNIQGDILISWVNLITGIIIIFTLAVSIFFFIWLFRKFIKHSDIFGTNVLSRLIGLGIITIIFPKAIRLIVKFPILFYKNFFSANFSRSLNIDPLASYSMDQISEILLNVIINEINRFTNILTSIFELLPVTSIILAILVWMIIGQLFSSSYSESSNDSGETLSRSRFNRYIQKLSPAKRYNILLFLLFFFSIYLSIASIVAIPWLEEVETSETINKERLQERLKNSLLPLEDYDNSLKAIETKDPFYSLIPYYTVNADSLFRKIPNTVPLELYKEKWNSRIQKIKSDISILKEQRQSIISELQSHRNQIAQKQDEQLKSAISDFEANVSSHMGVQEQNIYFQDVVSWFRRYVADLRSSFEGGLSSLALIDNNSYQWINVLQINLNEDIERVKRLEIDSSVYMGYFATYSQLPIHYNYFYLHIPSAEPGPNPPKPGLGLGIFGLISSWLLRTKSFALALIAGMLGFGMLGATISTLVRKQLKTDGSKINDVTEENLFNIVIQGLSAAIVVFLAVEGGLAIFTQGSQEPNAYVLFLTCLIGAVFSEKVWIWARNKLGDNLTGNDSGN